MAIQDSTGRRFGAALLLVALAGCAPGTQESAEAPKGAELDCSARADTRLRSMSNAGIRPTSALGLPAGRYALPATRNPTQLVVMFHGNHNESCSWRNHLRSVAALGAVGVAMDYTGQHDRDGVENYGWYVREGAADSIVAAQALLKRYPSLTTVIAFGVSMGGNASGIAVASPDAVRADGSPLFDYWIDIEGVNNLAEEYLIIRAVAQSGNADAVAAVAEIEEQNGGAIEDVPEAYAEITNVANADLMGYLKGAVVVSGIDDGLVSTDQTPQMAASLEALGVPTHLYTVVLKGEAESGSTATGLVLGNVDPAYESPFAGHGWEGSDTHLVMRTGLDALFALLGGQAPVSGYTLVTGSAAGSIP